MKLIEKLINIQSELKAPKGQRNSFGNYNYRSCEDILEALKPILLKHKCTVTINDDVVLVGDRFYIKATVSLHSESEALQVNAFARESLEKKGMDSAQVTGATSSYARKYALNGMFAIDDTKDADATNEHGKEEVKKEKQDVGLPPQYLLKSEKKQPATQAQVNALKKKFPMSDEEIRKIFPKFEGWDKLKFDQVNPMFAFERK